SGAGKTTLALELAGRGHKWIADDAVEIEKRRDGRLYGRSHALVKNLMEIKDIGVLQVQDVLAAACIADETPVDLIAEIGRGALPCVSTPSVGTPHGGRSESIIMGVRLPLIKIPCANDRAEKLENAAKVFS
ncbi:MAG: hypothetical protein Q8K46_01815, partial [Deltaproteobacteria bacterium]|nr:hypothetical protein [Deltaproteobacteria bacterium]